MDCGRNTAGRSLDMEKLMFRVMFIIWPGTSCIERLTERGLVSNRIGPFFLFTLYVGITWM